MRQLLLSAVLLLAAGTAQAEAPTWVVRDKDSEMVIFGSVHLLPPGLGWAPPRLTAALKATDDLWFEIPVDAATEREVAEIAGARGVMAPGQ